MDGPVSTSTSTHDGLTLWTALPDIALGRILGFLQGRDACSARGVCTQWRDGVDSTRHTCTFQPHAPLRFIFDMLKRCRPRLRKVVLAFREDADVIVTWMQANGMIRQLDVLDASYTRISLETVVSLAASFPSLTVHTRGAWQATVPSPKNTPRDVLEAQLWAFRDGGVPDGIASAFQHASPGNRRVTGPLERFSFMIRQWYSDLLKWQCYEYVSHIDVEGDAGTANFLVMIDRGVDGRIARCYAWSLSKQDNGCWMTDGVQLTRLADIDESRRGPATKIEFSFEM
eukprot:m.200046 g.200046  ORF g.200046 m.200046 type:complete len:286 (-) comp20942_c0_seq1:123-980(-)